VDDINSLLTNHDMAIMDSVALSDKLGNDLSALFEKVQHFKTKKKKK
jgi:hypothetical protein